MTTSRIPFRLRERTVRTLVSKSQLAICALLAGLAGCHQAADYQASTLPDRWRASPMAAIVDPSDIARKSRNSNLIYPGDTLEVAIGTGIEDREPTKWSLRVSEQGNIDIPLVGPVHVAGQELPQAERTIHQVSIERQQFVRPNVSVALKERHKINVRVVGEVNKPGTYEIEADGADLLAALVAAEWLTESADTVVELRYPVQPQLAGDPVDGTQLASASLGPATSRPAVSSTRVDLANSERTAYHEIKDGTVVSVLKRPRDEVSVAGLVRRPNVYEIPADQPMRVLDVLAKAGDRTITLANKVHVKRRAPNGEVITIQVPYDEAKQDSRSNLVLQPGDIVTVEETPLTFAVETLRSFVRFGFSSTVPSLFQ